MSGKVMEAKEIGGVLWVRASDVSEEVSKEVAKVRADTKNLRDYFAAHALGGCEVTVRDNMGFGYFEPAHDIAKRCYQIADAMLKARKS